MTALRKTLLSFKPKGYSLLEVVVAVFALTGLTLAAFSVFESGERLTGKIGHMMTAARLAQQIGEELHSKKISEISNLKDVPFPFPFNSYLYTIETAPYQDLRPFPVGNLFKISVKVTGPLDQARRQTRQTAFASTTGLLARQPYPYR